MNLSEMLCYADIGLLDTIAKQYACECSSHSKNELIQAILSALHRKDSFDPLISELTDGEIGLLNRLLFDRRSYYSLEELTAFVSQAVKERPGRAGGEEEGQEISPREMIAKFRRRGWLFNGHSQQTKYLFRMPEDIKRRFCDSFASYLSRQLIYIERPEAYRDEQMIIGRDVWQFLRFVHQHEVALTVEGTMYKRTQEQLMAAFHVKEELIKSRGWRFGYGRRFKDYPSRLSLIYDYCFFTGLIAETEKGLQLTEEGTKRVLQGLKEDPAEIYRFWLKLYKGPIPNLQALVQWLYRLCRAWTTVDSLQSSLVKMIQPFYYDQPEQILRERILHMMMHLGLLQIGEDRELGMVVRISELGDRILSGAYIPEEEKIELEENVPLRWEQD